MRLASHIWVSAFIRSERASGAYATVLRKGAPEAGAIFVAHNHLDMTFSVYAPAPQSEFAAGEASERRFERVVETADEDEMRRYLDKQVSFDPDCWIVETERRDAPSMLVTV